MSERESWWKDNYNTQNMFSTCNTIYIHVFYLKMGGDVILTNEKKSDIEAVYIKQHIVDTVNEQVSKYDLKFNWTKQAICQASWHLIGPPGYAHPCYVTCVATPRPRLYFSALPHV